MTHGIRERVVRIAALIIVIHLLHGVSHEEGLTKAAQTVWSEGIVGEAAPSSQSRNSTHAARSGDSPRDAGAAFTVKDKLRIIGRGIPGKRQFLMNEIGSPVGVRTVRITTAQERHIPLLADDRPATEKPESGKFISPAITSEPRRTVITDYVSTKPLTNSCAGLSLEDAVIQDRKDCVEFLLASGANPRAADRSGLTPLQEASRRCHTDLINVLIAGGADINERDRKGKTPLHFSVTLARFGGTRFLPPGEPLALIEAILAAGAIADARDKSGASVLHYLVHQDGPQVRKIMARFLDAGAALEGKTKHGWTALHEASLYHWPENVKVLIVKGANVNSRTKDGDTPLMAATFMSHTLGYRYREDDGTRAETVEILLKAGADVNARNSSGMTALGYALQSGKTDVVRVLQGHGATE